MITVKELMKDLEKGDRSSEHADKIPVRVSEQNTAQDFANAMANLGSAQAAQQNQMWQYQTYITPYGARGLSSGIFGGTF